MPNRRGALGLAIAALLCGAAPAAAATCAPARAGGDWPVGGHDLANTRAQPAASLPAKQARTLKPLWKFYDGHAGGLTTGNLTDFNATPVEAGGCVYVGSATSDAGAPNVFALNADTGAPVWQGSVQTGPAGLGGAVPGALAVDGDAVFVLVNQQGDGGAHGPYVQAFDRRTGAVLWRGAPFVTTAGTYTNASPTVGNGVIVAGFSAREGDPYGHGGFALISEQTGALLALTYTVDPATWGTPTAPKYAGGGIWTTPAIDPVGGYAYMGTGNPFSKKTPSPRADAIIKVDISRARPTFGQIVGYLPGNIEQFTEIIRTLSTPTCELLPDDPVRDLPALDPRVAEIQGLVGNSIGCVQLDLDFGAAANLFPDRNGRLLVGDLQKSGVYHVAHADDMSPAWMSLIGASCQTCNGSSTAVDLHGRTIFGDVSPGSLLTAISADGGRLKWYSPVGDGYHYEGVTLADGVLYTVDGLSSTLVAVRARDGLPLLRRSLIVDAGVDAIAPAGYSSASVAVARDTVYVEAGSHVLAYRPVVRSRAHRRRR